MVPDQKMKKIFKKNVERRDLPFRLPLPYIERSNTRLWGSSVASIMIAFYKLLTQVLGSFNSRRPTDTEREKQKSIETHLLGVCVCVAAIDCATAADTEERET